MSWAFAAIVYIWAENLSLDSNLLFLPQYSLFFFIFSLLQINYLLSLFEFMCDSTNRNISLSVCGFCKYNIIFVKWLQCSCIAPKCSCLGQSPACPAECNSMIGNLNYSEIWLSGHKIRSEFWLPGTPK